MERYQTLLLPAHATTRATTASDVPLTLYAILINPVRLELSCGKVRPLDLDF
jgi:hypothetical protein